MKCLVRPLSKGGQELVCKGDNVPQLRLPCQREDGRTIFYESAKVGYILNCTIYRGALFKGSWQVEATATTCLRVSNPTFYIYPPFILLAAIKVTAWRLGHRSRTDICAHSSHFGTHSGCPLCYEMPRSSFIKRGTRIGV